MKNLLWVGDAGVPSGFARATHETLKAFVGRYNITVLGVNYRGDPHDYPYPIYAAMAGGDWAGLSRLIWMCDKSQPDVIVIQNDPWNIPLYTKALAKVPEYSRVPIVAAVAVDGKNCAGKGLNDLSHGIFWTQFGLDEARAGGFTKPASIIPLGVDLDVYQPRDTLAARARKFMSSVYDDKFIVGNVNRNQPRKRMDLAIKYFAEWIRSYDVKDAMLYLHVAPTGDTGVQLKALAAYYGIVEHLALAEPSTWYGDTDDQLVDTYNCFDVQINPGQGEGFGLTTLEGMACGIPQIVSDWAALGDWAKGAAWLIGCSSTAIGPPYVNVIGGVADQALFVNALQSLYQSQSFRATKRFFCLERAHETRFRWENIGERFVEVVDSVVNGGTAEDIWKDLGRPEEVRA